MVLLGCAALAEDFPSFTVTGETTVDPAGLRAALDAMGLEPSQVDALAGLEEAWNGRALNLQAQLKGNAMTTMLYALDGETLAITEENTFAEGGARTLAVSGESRVELNADAIEGGFLLDLLLHGLPTLGLDGE